MKSKSFGHKNAPNKIGTTRHAAPVQSDSEDENQGNITNNTMNHNHDVQLRPIVSRSGRKSSRARVSPRKLPTRPPPPPPPPAPRQ
uniref:WH2 domain-containing protein n=1 Tax=Globodera pallida TaxID=36090 RepID=A0A183C4S6_GLOPA